MMRGVRASSIRIEFDLVDDRVIEGPLHHVGQAELHVVAQIVEAELVVGAVGDVGVVGGLALLVVELVDDHADREAEETVDLAHPFRVALGQVVVDRDDMDALARKRVEIDRQRGNQGLAFAGLHLGDHALVQDHAAQQLHVEMALAERAPSRLAHRGEGVDQDVVDLLPLVEPGAQPFGALAQLGVGQARDFGLQGIDRRNLPMERLENAIVRGAENLPGDGAEHAK